MRIITYQHPRSLAPRATFSNPWVDFGEEIDRVMNAAFSGLLSDPTVSAAVGHPRVDLYEDKENLYVRGELPGMKREDIHVELGDGVLSVSGTRRGFAANGEGENKSGFSRTLSIPTRVQSDKITANYENGILTVTLPKAEEVKPKRIAVQVK